MFTFCDRHRLAIRRTILCVSILLTAGQSACGSHAKLRPPPLATQAELTAKGKASVVFASEISTAIKSPMCMVSGVTLLKIQKNQITSVIVVSVKIADVPLGTEIFFAELDAGTYALTEIKCDNYGNYSVSYKFATLSSPFASFEVNPGEIVDLGTVHVNMFDIGATIFSSGEKKPVPIVLVNNKPEHHRTMALPEPLRAGVKLRMMRSHFPAEPAAISKACDEQRLYRSTHGSLASAFSILQLQIDAPICKFVTAKSN